MATPQFMSFRFTKLIPDALRAKLAGSSSLQSILHNMGWLFFDKFIRLGSGLFVGAWVARYLGPEQFGLLNFSISFAALFGVAATLGLDGIVVRELVRTPSRRDDVLGSAFALKLAGGAVTLLAAVGAT